MDMTNLPGGENVKISTDGKKLTIEMDLTIPGHASTTGKSVVVASTHGNREIEQGLFLGINLFRKE